MNFQNSLEQTQPLLGKGGVYSQHFTSMSQGNMLTCTPRGNLESQINLRNMFLDLHFFQHQKQKLETHAWAEHSNSTQLAVWS